MIRALLLTLLLASCAHEPHWCAWDAVYKHGRRCASGRPIEGWSGEPVIYVEDCNACAER